MIKISPIKFESNESSLVRTLATEATPLVVGALLGQLGRSTGQDYLPIVPIGMDLIGGCNYTTPRGLWMLTKYSIGASLPYLDKIIPLAEETIKRI